MLSEHPEGNPGEDRGVGEGTTGEWRVPCTVDVRSGGCGEVSYRTINRRAMRGAASCKLFLLPDGYRTQRQLAASFNYRLAAHPGHSGDT